ncbi:DNA primase [Segetibacter sp. 3557_3]|uniref:toprim domain-containing protein n=1 Tax=Segetibacter sp. 3557_3 TaxID=2547429 RepID=UPI001058AC47|nr:toprim domain-containing protein [Segetibacter sp. 3557_3]TDH17782.1 DNA primase [Segetibacter sp. 3557_3]
MEFRKAPSFTEAKQYDIVEYLAKLGHLPDKVSKQDYWYHSPLRLERTPSFKVNRSLNRWYDHGIGKGGNIIDFAVLYHQCTPAESLAKIAGNSFIHDPVVRGSEPGNVKPENEKKIHIVKESSLHSFSLCRYLNQRKISIEIASEFCREITYELYGKTYNAIGFKNDLGGYELRNPFIKLSSSPKGITTIQKLSKNVTVFEGFTDFLSYLSIQDLKATETNFAVLNSLSFFETSRQFLDQHETILLYLDRDKAGQNYSRYALSLSPRYQDKSSLYQNYKDLNEWVMHIGKSPQHSKGLHR